MVANGQQRCYRVTKIKSEVIHANPGEIIREAGPLPVEERPLVVDSRPWSLNPPDPELDRKWAAVAKVRRRFAL